MARNTCYQYDFNSGACVSYGDTYIYPGAFYGSNAGGGMGPGGGNGQIGADSGNQNTQGAPVTSFPAAGQGNVLPASQTPALGGGVLGNDGIWWLVLGGVALWMLSK